MKTLWLELGRCRKRIRGPFHPPPQGIATVPSEFASNISEAFDRSVAVIFCSTGGQLLQVGFLIPPLPCCIAQEALLHFEDLTWESSVAGVLTLTNQSPCLGAGYCPAL